MTSSPSITELGVVMQPGMYIRRSKKAPVQNSDDVAPSVSNMKIGIKKLEIAANIGVYSHEKQGAQPLFLDIIVEIDNNHKIENDDLTTTIDYDGLWKAANGLAASGHFNLIETFVSKLGQIILQDSRIVKVSINAEKPMAIKNAQSAIVSIDCVRD